MTSSYDVVLVRRVPQSSGDPTFIELGPLRRWSTLRWTQEVAAAGSAEVAVTVDALESTMKAALLDLSAQPCELWIYRDDAMVHAGPVVGYRIQDRRITFASAGLLAYLDFMIRTADYSTFFTDQATIVSDLIDGWQSQAYGDFGLDTGHLTATGTTQDLTLKGTEYPVVGEVLAKLGARDNGFDLEVTPADRRVVIHAPEKGQDLSGAVFLTGPTVNVVYAQSVPAGVIASEGYVTADASSGVSLTASASNTTLRASFGRCGIAGTVQDVTDSFVLADHAAQLVAFHDHPLHEITPALPSVAGFSYDDFAVGDTIAYEYDAGLGTQSFTPRIRKLTVDVLSGVERLTLELE